MVAVLGVMTGTVLEAWGIITFLGVADAALLGGAKEGALLVVLGDVATGFARFAGCLFF